MKQALTAQDILAAAQGERENILTYRRTIHRDPEVGSPTPRTAAYIAGELKKLGYQPQALGGGLVTAITGKDTGRCVLLRADMDALAGREQSGLDFQADNGAMHACGHDMHAAMLLGAAALLRKYQDRLNGTVKLVFQPDEEGFTGAKAMLKAGVLENPKPQAAIALHVNSGTPSGMVLCGRGTFMAGCTLFRVTVTGKGCHGAMPETGVDPINIAAHIYLALQELVSREVPAKSPAVVTVGRFQAGQLPNVIPDRAVLEGTIRTFDRDLSQRLMDRIRQVAESVAAAFRGSALVEEPASAPPLHNDPALMEQMANWAGGRRGGPGDPPGPGGHGIGGFCLLYLRAALRLSAAGGGHGPGGPSLRTAHAQPRRGLQRGRAAPGRRPAHLAGDARVRSDER